MLMAVFRPVARRIKRHARRGKALSQGPDRVDFCLAAEHATFELEVAEAKAGVRRFGQPHDRGRRPGFLVAQAQPIVGAARGMPVGQFGLAAISYEEQVAERGHPSPLLPLSQQRGNGQGRGTGLINPRARLPAR
jgi:hypothetical protein